VALTQQKVSYSEGILLEDAEDGTISGWTIYDSDPAGATITNEFDTIRQSKVIDLKGTGTDNGFQFSQSDGSSLAITRNFKVDFSLMTKTNFIIYFQVKTSAGDRYLTYTQSDQNALGSGSYIYYGLGTTSIDGSWHSFTRDLQADLLNAQPNATLISIDKILIRGSLRVDNIVCK
jgi:hypothetical protein